MSELAEMRQDSTVQLAAENIMDIVYLKGYAILCDPMMALVLPMCQSRIYVNRIAMQGGHGVHVQHWID